MFKVAAGTPLSLLLVYIGSCSVMLGCLCKKLSYVMFQRSNDVELPGTILSLYGLSFNNGSVIVNLNLHINLLVRVFLLMIKNNLVLTQGSIDAKEV